MNLKNRPSYTEFVELVRKHPEEKVYIVNRSLIKQLSLKTLKYAWDRKIVIVPSDSHAGRPQKYDDAERMLIKESKRPAKELSERYNIPLRTVYFIKAGN